MWRVAFYENDKFMNDWRDFTSYAEAWSYYRDYDCCIPLGWSVQIEPQYE